MKKIFTNFFKNFLKGLLFALITCILVFLGGAPIIGAILLGNVIGFWCIPAIIIAIVWLLALIFTIATTFINKFSEDVEA